MVQGLKEITRSKKLHKIIKIETMCRSKKLKNHADREKK